MSTFRRRGKCIKEKDASLVFQFIFFGLSGVWLVSFIPFHLSFLLSTTWQFDVFQAHFISTYGLVTLLISLAITTGYAYLYYRYRYDKIKQVIHRQKLAKMILENGWYETKQVTQEGFFKDIPSNKTKEKISHFPKMYYRFEKGLLHMLYFNKDEYNTLAKDIIRKFKTSTVDLEMPISRLFYDNLINLERDQDFLIEIMSSNLSRRTVRAFVYYLEKEAKSVIEYKDIILALSRHLIQIDIKKYEGVWGIQDEISKLVIGLYDETSGATKPELKRIAQECLDIWDLMFEKQIGPVRRLSREMMER